jgi:hypothetical protein
MYILVGNGYAIGPFNTGAEAIAYRQINPRLALYRTMELLDPAYNRAK